MEDHVCTEKPTGCCNLPFKGFERNQAWLLTAGIAADLLCQLQLLDLEEAGELARAEPETLHTTILRIAARFGSHARSRLRVDLRARPERKIEPQARTHSLAVSRGRAAAHRTDCEHKSCEVDPEPASRTATQDATTTEASRLVLSNPHNSSPLRSPVLSRNE